MATIPPALQSCIQELCEIADPEAVRKWFSRWIRSIEVEVDYTDREAELRDNLSTLGPNEPRGKDVQLSREQHAVYSVGTSAVQKHGAVDWSYDADQKKKVCKATLYTLSMKGPLDEGTL